MQNEKNPKYDDASDFLIMIWYDNLSLDVMTDTAFDNDWYYGKWYWWRK